MMEKTEKKQSERSREAVRASRAERQSGNLDEARAILEASLESNPGDRLALYELAILYETDFLDYNHALHYYNQILESNADEIRAWLGRGLILYLLCNDAGALEAFQTVIRLKPDYSATAWLYSARLLQDPRLALQHLETARKMLGTEGIPDALKGELLQISGNYSEAFQEFKRLYEKDRSPWLGIRCASLLNKLSRYDEALQYINKSSSLEGVSPAYHLEAAIAWTGLENYEEAERESKKALDIRPSFGPALRVLARTLLAKKDAGGAFEILEMHPDSTDPDFIDVRASVLLALGRPTEVKGLLSDMDPEMADPHLLVHLAEACYRTSEFEEALKLYDRLRKLRPDDPFVHFHFGLCLDRLNR